ncbi:cellulose binding domain-containing protein [Sphaerisporangium rhizosphaerae]|uniref:Cellulose binding domain-containing protein n=1 Tax=Sphaerisporangium rhizosphaerae TaxID=2269375 RepID=A0ABW2P6P3_9ACTN
MQRRVISIVLAALTALAGLGVTAPAFSATARVRVTALADTTPPTVPAGLSTTVRCNPLSVTLTWTASTDNVGVTGYDVYGAPYSGGTFVPVGTTTATSFTQPINGLYQYEVRARDAAGNTSAFTEPVRVVPPPCPTMPPDPQPPTTPGTPTATVTCGSVTLTWTASTDNVGVIGYEIWRAPGATGGTFALVGTTTTTSFTQSGVGVYRFQVRARDATGNYSAFTSPVTVYVPACPTRGCTAVYSPAGDWPGAFQGKVVVTNTGTTATTGWTVTLTFSGGQQITRTWNAAMSNTANPYTITNLSFNGALPPNGSTTFGFQATTTSGADNTPTTSCIRTPSGTIG